ncbi:hypothetical protein [Sulfurovum sp. NBC37-1]|uniref:hypothetical protein n=1 Tax=Sulfurovum sp. (strain NBC37-1) TaxID=387093 RepID=UPI00031BC4C0|nr:hypothetical protein [Sulfurovum sp. NBC37-1]
MDDKGKSITKTVSMSDMPKEAVNEALASAKRAQKIVRAKLKAGETIEIPEWLDKALDEVDDISDK